MVSERQNRQKQIALPKIYSAGGNLSKKWFIYFYYRDPKINNMVRFRKYDGINDFDTVEDRTTKARAVAESYKRKLLRGWSPFDDGKVIFEDSLEYVAVSEKYGKLKSGVMPIRTLLAAFLNTFKHHRKATYQTYQSKLRIFIAWLEREKLDKNHISYFTEKNAEDFFEWLLVGKVKRSPQTFNSFRVLLKSFFDYAIKLKKVRLNPIAEIKFMKEEKTIPKFYNEGMIARIKAHIVEHDPQLWLSVQLQYYCYIRPHEQRFLQLKQVDLWAGQILVPANISKNCKDRKVTLPQVFWDQLIEMRLEQYDQNMYLFGIAHVPDEKPISKNYFYRHYQKVVEALRIPKEFKFYNWKHTGAAMAALSGINLESIRQQLGHHSLDQVKEYIEAMVGDSTKEFRDKHKAI